MMPLQRGAYALATKDRKTVIRCLILSKEEAGFDPEAFANSVLAAFATPELVNRIRATWSLVQLSFETHDAMVAPSMSFLMDLSKRFAQTTDGVVADPICRRYFLPEEIIPDPNHGEIDSVLHLAVSTQPEGPNIRAYTLGLQKFGLPEFEVAELEESQGPMAEAFLLSLGQSHLNGRIAGIGDRVGSKAKPFEVCQGGLDRKIWDGIACFELLPPRGVTASDALAEWARESTAN
jgi:hypothetical protein